MPTCPLTAGYDYSQNCTAFQGGVKVIAFVESYNKNTITVASGVVTAMALASTKVFRVYRVKKNKSFFTDNATRTEAGGKFYTPTISLFLPDLGTALRKEVDLLISNSLIVAVLDYNNVWRMAGYYSFLEATTVDANFGTLIGDSHAQTVVFTGQDADPMLEINTSTATSLSLPLL
jgi:hypothetical protein